MYEFNRVVERRGTASLKWDFGARFAGREDLLPLWVADMDFPAPPEIAEAIARRAAHEVYGYTLEPESWFAAAMAWLARRHGWRVEREWLVPSPGVIAILSAAIAGLSAPGDAVVVQPPVYHPFALRIRANGRTVAENPLLVEGDRFRMDLDGLERILSAGARVLMLCSPHNPGGTVWRRGELEGIVALCARHGATIVSDEIHADLVHPPSRHLPVASLSAEAARRTVTCFSATKTFNLAGLGGALAIVPDPKVRARLVRAAEAQTATTANCFAIAAAEAGWRSGERWLEEMLAYVRENYALLKARLADRLPAARVLPLEATYLAWIDLRSLKLSDDEVRSRLLEAGVWLDEGRKFGRGGEGFQRLNLACPRVLLAEAVDRMVGALAQRAPLP